MSSAATRKMEGVDGGILTVDRAVMREHMRAVKKNKLQNFEKGVSSMQFKCMFRVPARGKFWISGLLRSFLVYSWGEIAKAGRPTAKPGCCV